MVLFTFLSTLFLSWTLYEQIKINKASLFKHRNEVMPIFDCIEGFEEVIDEDGHTFKSKYIMFKLMSTFPASTVCVLNEEGNILKCKPIITPSYPSFIMGAGYFSPKPQFLSGQQLTAMWLP